MKEVRTFKAAVHQTVYHYKMCRQYTMTENAIEYQKNKIKLCNDEELYKFVMDESLPQIKNAFNALSIKIKNERDNDKLMFLLLYTFAGEVMFAFSVLYFRSVDISKTGEKMISIYQKKDADYSGYFGILLNEDGLLGAKIHIGYKLHHFILLTKEDSKEAQVKMGIILDTLLELANYCEMTIVYINNRIKKRNVRYKDETLNKGIDARTYAAKMADTPQSTLAQLSKDPYCVVREYVASNPNTPVEVLKRLAKDNEYRVRKNVALHPSTPARTLKQLAKDKMGIVREAAAWNHKIPVESLRELANDSYFEVRRAVARNINAPKEVMEQFAKEGDATMTRLVAGNPNTPAKILEKLSNSFSIDVRIIVAGNDSTPASIRKKLVHEADLYISKQTEKLESINRYLGKYR